MRYRFFLFAIGFLLTALVAIGRNFLGLTMAQTLATASVVFFIAPLLLGSPSSGNSAMLKNAIWLSLPFILIGIAVIYFALNPIFAILPLAAPVGALGGYALRSSFRRRLWGLAFTATLLWIVLTYAGYYAITPSTLAHSLSEELHEPAPAFQVQTLDGETINSSHFAGKVLLLDFWATWCRPCLVQFPELQRIYDKYANHSEAAMLMINTGWNGDDVPTIRRFMQANPYTFPVAFDSAGQMSRDFDVVSLPHTLLIDRRGVIRVRHTGLPAKRDEFARALEKWIERLLAEASNE